MLDWEPFHTLFKIVLNADLAVNSSSVWLSISGEETGTRTKPYVFLKKKKSLHGFMPLEMQSQHSTAASTT